MGLLLHLRNILYSVLANLIMSAEVWDIFFGNGRCEQIVWLWKVSGRIAFRNRVLFVRLHILLIWIEVKCSLANTLGPIGWSTAHIILALKSFNSSDLFSKVTRWLRNTRTILWYGWLQGNRPFNEGSRSDKWLCKVSWLGGSKDALWYGWWLGCIHLLIVIAE